MNKYFIISLLTSILLACMPNKTEQSIEQAKQISPPLPPNPVFAKGEMLFKQHCSSCHSVDRKIIGPALRGITAKYADDKKWLYAFIRNSQKLIKAKDKKAIAIYEEYNGAAMFIFTFLNDEDIDAILFYADQYIACPIPTTEKVHGCY